MIPFIAQKMMAGLKKSERTLLGGSMHVTHLFSVKASSHKEAMKFVEQTTEEWGSFNNWKTVMGAISEDDEVLFEGKPRHFFQTWNLARVKKFILEAANHLYLNQDLVTTITAFKMNEDSLNVYQWDQLVEYCKFKTEQKRFHQEEFNLWSSELYSWQLDQPGLTNLMDISFGNKKYIVFADVHC
jgi:hypothetical protein